MDNLTSYKFAIIGYGGIGRRHAELIANHPAATLAAICDTYPIENAPAPFYTEVATIFAAHPDIDVVNVCSPNGLHAEHALLALQHNKHVVIEKPMALSKMDGERILHTALTSDKKVFCVMQNRYAPVSLWLKNLLAEQRLGKLFYIQVNCFWNRDNRYYEAAGMPHSWRGTKALDGGPLYTQFAHFIDMLYWLFGEIDITTAHIRKTSPLPIAVEDFGEFQFQKTGQSWVGKFTYTTAVWDKNMESSMTFLGSQGSIKVSGQYMEHIEYAHIKDCDTPTLPSTDAWQNHYQVIDNVVQTLRQQAPIATNALEGLKVVEIIEQFYKKAA